MTSRTRIATAGLILAALAAVLLWQRPAVAPPPATGDPAAAAGTGDAAHATLPSVAESPGREAVASSRPAAASQETATTGTLVVHVRWAKDRSPAAQIGLGVMPSTRPAPVLEARAGRTDAGGVCRFEQLPPGPYWLTTERGNDDMATVLAGRTVDHHLELPRGFDVNGIVVDAAGVPVAGAEIWHDNRFVVASSGADGRFTVRSLSDDWHWLGARAGGYAPSPAQMASAGAAATVDVKLVLGRRGGAITGRVCDGDGHPVEHALVLVGRRRRGPGTAEDWRDGRPQDAEPLRTDAEGRFATRAVAPGPVLVAARAPGHAVWRSETEVFADVTRELEIRLVPGVTLTGAVRDAGGELQAGVGIQVGNEFGLSSHATTDGAGAFRLAGLDPQFVAIAEDPKRGKVQAELRGEPGTTIHWDAVLVGGASLTGRVVDERGQPVAGCRVEAISREHNGHDDTDAAGAFAVTACRGTSYHVAARMLESPFPLAELRGVDPRAGAVVLVVQETSRPSIRIRVRVVDEHGEPARTAQISPLWSGHGSSPLESLPEGKDTFELGPYPSGEWLLILRAQGRPDLRLGPETVAPGATWDLGTVRIEPAGALLVELAREADAPATPVELTIFERSGPRTETARLEGTTARFDVLPPGRFTIAVATEGCSSVQVPFAITSGQTTRLTLPVRAARRCTIRVRDLRTPPVRLVDLVVRDAAGQLLVERRTWANESGARHPLRLCLPTGDLRVDATAPGASASAILRVEAAGPEPTLELELR